MPESLTFHTYFIQSCAYLVVTFFPRITSLTVRMNFICRLYNTLSFFWTKFYLNMAADKDYDTPHAVRFTDISNEPQKMLMPINGYEKLPFVSLEEAVKPLVSMLPKVQDYAYIAKQRCEKVPADGLTRDQSASITLYTMDWEPQEECLYYALNTALRTENRRQLNPWLSYLKLIIAALMQLPSTGRVIYRGVKMDFSKQYPIGKTFVWWGFSSCTTKVEVLNNENFLGKTGERTIFNIECRSGKDISRHSYYPSENEVLILPARQFKVDSWFEPAPGLHVIQLRETEAKIRLVETIPKELPKGKKARLLYLYDIYQI